MNILIHICCAPCAIYPIDKLLSEGHNVTGYFLNPNIHPKEEFALRKKALMLYQEKSALKIIYSDIYMEEKWRELKEDRCNYCYGFRLERAFIYAKENHFDAVTTSLLVSPYQKHNLIIDICNFYSAKYQIKFYYENFQEGYYIGREKAKELGLYRQKYCGCILSKEERIEELKLKGKIF